MTQHDASDGTVRLQVAFARTKPAELVIVGIEQRSVAPDSTC